MLETSNLHKSVSNLGLNQTKKEIHLQAEEMDGVSTRDLMSIYAKFGFEKTNPQGTFMIYKPK